MKKLRIEIETEQKKHTADIDFPENWNEVPADLFPHLASLYLATDKQMGVHDKAVRAFCLLTWKHWNVIEQLSDRELYDLLHLVNWVFDQLDLEKNHMPEVNVGKKIFVGPADGMENLRFGEWCAASYFASMVPDDETGENLRNLAAVLCRPVGSGAEYMPGHERYRGDRRQRFNDQLVADRSKLFNSLPKPVLQGIYVWFCSCRYQMFNSFPGLKEGQPDKPESVTGDGWLDVYDDLRGDPKFAPAESLEDQFLATVLHSLQRNKQKMAELKDKYKI